MPCGYGRYAIPLARAGYRVVGVDRSETLLAEARRRAGHERWPKLTRADYRELPFPDGSFNAALNLFSSLGYLGDEEDTRVLAEIGRVLRPGGRLIASVEHPFVTHLMHREAGRAADHPYMETTNWHDEWEFGGRTQRMSFWHRPLHAMTRSFTDAGFRILAIDEPDPDPAAHALVPEELADKPRFLCFLFFVLEVPGPSAG